MGYFWAVAEVVALALCQAQDPTDTALIDGVREGQAIIQQDSPITGR